MILTIKRADDVKAGETLATDDHQGAFVYDVASHGLDIVMQVERHGQIRLAGSQLIGVWHGDLRAVAK